MRLSEFTFDLPKELIALYPPYHQAHNADNHRDEARLMIVDRATGKIDIEEGRQFKHLSQLFNDGDLFVGNDTKVFPAKLWGYKDDGGKQKGEPDIEVLLLRELNGQTHLWDVVVEPARKIRVGNKIYFGDSNLVAEVVDNTTSQGRTIRFLYHGTSQEFAAIVDQIGEPPLPLVIERKVEPEDRERFQTIYARNPGAISAPGAGLHFSPHMFKQMQIRGIDMAFVTLHTGRASYRAVEVDDLNKFKPDSEPFTVPGVTATRFNKALTEGKKIVTVGTSAMRAIEASVITDGMTDKLKEHKLWTDKFYVPPVKFRLTSHLVTNFHLPATLPYMAACSFGGLELMREAYRIAIENKFRFYAFGDAMLIK